MIDSLIAAIKESAHTVPPEWFALVGSFTEEIIAPIPSPLVMTLAGSVAISIGKPLPYLLLLALIGTIGKTAGSYVLYILADKTENLIMGRIGKYLGITHTEVEAFGAKISKGWRDVITLFVLRATPIIPTTPVSLAAGILKLELKSYLLGTALGVFVRNLFYLYLGYSSLGALENISQDLEIPEFIGSFITLIGIAGTFGYIWYRKYIH